MNNNETDIDLNFNDDKDLKKVWHLRTRLLDCVAEEFSESGISMMQLLFLSTSFIIGISKIGSYVFDKDAADIALNISSSIVTSAAALKLEKETLQ